MRNRGRNLFKRKFNKLNIVNKWPKINLIFSLFLLLMEIMHLCTEIMLRHLPIWFFFFLVCVSTVIRLARYTYTIHIEPMNPEHHILSAAANILI